MKQIQVYTSLWRETNTVYAEWAKNHGLSFSELLVVLSLAEMKKDCLQKDICKQWTLPKQTVSSVLKTFMERSMVKLSLNESDRRSKTIELTTEGEIFCKTISGKLQKFECVVWDKMGEKNSALLIEKMTLYNRFLKEGVRNENT